jgi:hypothetical protein
MSRQFEARRNVERDRDEAIRALVPDAQKAAYDKVMADYRTRRQDLDREREKLIQDATDRSRALLDDAQKIRWDGMSRDMRERGPRWGGGGPRATTRASEGTNPAATTEPSGAGGLSDGAGGGVGTAVEQAGKVTTEPSK